MYIFIIYKVCIDLKVDPEACVLTMLRSAYLVCLFLVFIICDVVIVFQQQQYISLVSAHKIHKQTK